MFERVGCVRACVCEARTDAHPHLKLKVPGQSSRHVRGEKRAKSIRGGILLLLLLLYYTTSISPGL